MVEVLNVLRFVMCYVLSLIYSIWFSLVIIGAFIFKRKTKFWQVKDRSAPPKILTSEEFGEHKFAKINGIKIHYVEKGDPKKPLLLFVHGFPEFWFSWRYQLKEFSKDYWTIAIDQRGYSESDKPANVSDYDIDNLVGDIYELVKELGREKFTLICHDWGSIIGFRYVLKHMDTLDKYVMIGAPPAEIWNDMIVKSVKQFFMAWYVFFFQMPYLPEFCLRTDDLKCFETMEHSSKEDLEAYKYTFAWKGAFTAPLNYYRAITRTIYFEKRLARPTHFVPGLYLLGELDKFISLRSGKLTKRIYDNLEFKVVKGANHFAQQHAPKETNDLIREFLEKK